MERNIGMTGKEKQKMSEVDVAIRVPEAMKPHLQEEISEKFDYTKWQREFYDQFSSEELHDRVIAYAKAHPYSGNAKEIIETTNLCLGRNP